MVAVGDVAGKGSPAALLMALLLAMLRTLVDEGLEAARLVERLNVQVARHSPASRFITLFYGLYDPATGRLQYVNAGHLPPLLRRADGRFERITGDTGSGLALGMFEQATYDDERRRRSIRATPRALHRRHHRGREQRRPGVRGRGPREVITSVWTSDSQQVGRAILAAVERYAQDVRLVDDLTALVLKRGRVRQRRAAKTRLRLMRMTSRFAALANPILALAGTAGASIQSVQDRPLQADGIVRLLLDLESAIGAGRVEALRAIATPALSERGHSSFRSCRAWTAGARADRARAHAAAPTASRYDVIATCWSSRQSLGRVSTWQISAAPGPAAGQFLIEDLRELAAVDGLIRLQLDTTRQFA